MRVRSRFVLPLLAAAISVGIAPALIASPLAHAPIDDDTPVLLTPKGEHETGDDEASFDKLRDAYYWSRLLSGDDPITLEQAATLRGQASKQASTHRQRAAPPRRRARRHLDQARARTRSCRSGARPTPSRRCPAASARWPSATTAPSSSAPPRAACGPTTPAAGTWTSRTNDTDTQSVGALAIAPSNDKVVYMGSGEGALSGDTTTATASTAPTDGGMTWTHVSHPVHRPGDHRTSSSTRRTPTTSTPRPCAAAAATTARPPRPTQPYGVYESTDGGATWTLRKGTDQRDPRRHRPRHGPAEPQGPVGLVLGRRHLPLHRRRADLGQRAGRPAGRQLPRGRHPVLARHLAPGRRTRPRRSTPGSTTSTPGRVPRRARSQDHRRRRALGPTRPGPRPGPTPSSTTAARSASTTTSSSRTRRTPNVVYALGSYGYNNSPAVRWHLPVHRRGADLAEPRLRPAPRLPRDRLPAEQHPAHRHRQRRRRLAVVQPAAAGTAPAARCRTTDWQNLNGTVDPNTAALVHATGLAIAQFTSHRNGARRSPASTGAARRTTARCASRSSTTAGSTRPSGDGGQVIVDQTTPNTAQPEPCRRTCSAPTSASRPYRFDPSETNTFFGNEADRRRHQPAGPRRVLRPVGAEPRQRQPDVPRHLPAVPHRQRRGGQRRRRALGRRSAADLTSGCTGAAPNGARGCFISAIGVADGGDGVYAGTDDGCV